MKKAIRQITILIAVLFTSNINTHSQDCLDVDIILLVDFSGSVNGYEPFIIDAINSFTNRYDLDQGTIKIGIIVFASGIDYYVPLTSNRTELLKATEWIKENPTYIGAGRGTALLPALNVVRAEFMENSRSVNKILIIISDGEPDNMDMCHDSVWEIKQQFQVILVGILIDDKEANPEFMKSISEVYVSTNYEYLSKTVEDLQYCL